MQKEYYVEEVQPYWKTDYKPIIYLLKTKKIKFLIVLMIYLPGDSTFFLGPGLPRFLVFSLLTDFLIFIDCAASNSFFLAVMIRRIETACFMISNIHPFNESFITKYIKMKINISISYLYLIYIRC